MALLWVQIVAYVVLALFVITVAVVVINALCMPTPINLKGKHVVVVGGSSGIGLAIAELALQEGALVTILARNKERLEEAKAKLDLVTEKSGEASRVFIRSVDAANQDAAIAGTEAAIGHWGPISVLVCSQGVSRPKRFDETPYDVFQMEVNTNYWGTLHMIRAALPSLKASGGPARIALVSSQAGQVGVYGYANYSATKFALRGFAEVLEQELAPYNILMSVIYPTDTDTPQLVEENKVKHPVTKLISESSAVMSAMAVAKASLPAIKKGLFTISVNFDGFMLGMATAGMGPQPSVGLGVLEVLTAGILRVVALVTLWGWFGTIRKWHKEHEQVPLY